MEERPAKARDKVVVYVDGEIEDLVPGYLENRRRDVKALREALAREDYEAIRVLGHSMKGTGGGYGFAAITEIGRALEQAAGARDADAVQEWTDELLGFLERVEVVYREGAGEEERQE